ncbi:uncharacterized protein LOC117538732 [Gymnodraco acuticeps]|uniref:Uncharacterized protein LOC117538732 n=1 Tax=Gymnodraco acuticeps TaxID=8218 RepID=A0A6P8TY08_GYMAC|nr:uncharacterized protein LOC117538732 [Gymnodraco acuticeps]
MSNAPDLTEQHNMEVRSQSNTSSSSRRSSRLGINMLAAEARAKAEAARTKAAYAKRQVDMEVEKARIDATLHALKEEGEAEAASAAANVLEAAVDIEFKEHQNKSSHFSLAQQSMQRTSEYVNAHYNNQENYEMGHQTNHEEQQAALSSLQAYPQHTEAPNIIQSPSHQAPLSLYQQRPQIPLASQAHINALNHSPSHYTNAAYNYPRGSTPSHVTTPRPSEISDLATYLARRDIVLSGLKMFDNKPENYLSWKAGFCNAIEGLNLKPSEELDLLTRWLDRESLQLVKILRAVNINYPMTGLNMAWQRLDKSYGSPEAIEASLFTRLENFPKILNKDFQRLQELADLLLEVEAAKCEGYLPGLSFLDTSRGVTPIVEKLPYNLQDQWIIRGSTYKKEHQVLYPPFSFFVKFVQSHAEMINDPSFAFQNSSAQSLKSEHPPSEAVEDSEQQFTKDCKADIHCSECVSNRHISALHAGPPNWGASGPSTSPAVHGGEQVEQATEVATSHCTEVCGKDLQVEDETFLHIMDKDFTKDDCNSWVAPLPFRTPRQHLPNNQGQALSRLMSLRRTLTKKPEMKGHFVDFMKKIFSNGHAEPAPTLDEHQECWYLPSFGVYHPQKPGQIRVVFDSSAQYKNVSLNNVLLRGPDLNNNLLGVLIRFRTEPVAVMSDIQQMFHSFLVRQDHRDYLRFLWFRDHQLDNEVMEFRIKVHVFGNCPSPAVAIYGLKRTAMEGEKEFGTAAR